MCPYTVYMWVLLYMWVHTNQNQPAGTGPVSSLRMADLQVEGTSNKSHQHTANTAQMHRHIQIHIQRICTTRRRVVWCIASLIRSDLDVFERMLCMCVKKIHTHTHTRAHTHTHSLSLSLTHTHTHTHTNYRRDTWKRCLGVSAQSYTFADRLYVTSQ